MKKSLYCSLFVIFFAYYLGQSGLAFSTYSLSKDQDSIAQRKGTILIVGVEHAPGQFRTDKFSPAHIRATLEAFKPQVIGVESNPEWFAKEQFYRSTYEAQHLAVLFALDNKIPVYGIDWIGEKNYTQRAHTPKVRNIKKLWENPAEESTPYQYGLSSWNNQLPAQDDTAPDFFVLNGKEYGEKSIKWIDEGKGKKGSPQEYMEERDNHIVNYITEVADKHPGSRLAIVIGSMHKADLERKLLEKGFKVVGPQSVVRAASMSDGRKMDSSLTAQDIAAILAEAWDSTAQSGATRERGERLLKRLLELSEKDPKAKAWGEYFSARHKMLQGDYAGASRDFQKIAGGKKLSGFPFRSYGWRQYLTVQQSALLELGRIADLQERREEAIRHYKQLLLSITVPEYSEDYHNDYLFYATAYNAVRFLTQTPYSKKLELEKRAANFQTVSSSSTTESSEELKKAMNLSRIGKWLEAATLIEDFLKKGNSSLNERCEGYIIAASAYARDKKPVDARRHLKTFDAECGDLSRESWIFQRRGQIEELLK